MSITKLTFDERVAAYNAAFPKYPRMLADKGWILGVWNVGNNYKGSGFHGSYPNSYLKRITSMFPDMVRALHLFSGSLPPGDYVRFDRRTDLPNGVDVVGEANELASHFPANSFDIIYADPPYSEEDAQRYGTCLISRNVVVKQCLPLLRPGGFLCWMDMILPMYAKKDWKRCGEICITRSTNHRVRAVFIFRKHDAPTSSVDVAMEGFQ